MKGSALNEMKTKCDVAVIGAGVMGSAIIDRLVSQEHKVTAFDASPEAIEKLTAKGIKVVKTPAYAVSKITTVILSLNHADIVEKVVFGQAGIAQAACPNLLVIDMSSIDPSRTEQLARRLKSETGARWVDCPLSGGVPAVSEGKLTVMAGGDPEDFEEARRVMNSLCKNYTLMGANGAGQMTKLINQLFCAVTFQAVAEAVKLAESAGVIPEMIPKALLGGRADSAILQEFFLKFAKRDFSITGKIGNMQKDLNSLQSFFLNKNLALPLTSQISDYHRMLCINGLAEKDSAEMIAFLDGL